MLSSQESNDWKIAYLRPFSIPVATKVLSSSFPVFTSFKASMQLLKAGYNGNEAAGGEDLG